MTSPARPGSPGNPRDDQAAPGDRVAEMPQNVRTIMDLIDDRMDLWHAHKLDGMVGLFSEIRVDELNANNREIEAALRDLAAQAAEAEKVRAVVEAAVDYWMWDGDDRRAVLLRAAQVFYLATAQPDGGDAT